MVSWTTKLLKQCARAHAEPTKPQCWEYARKFGIDAYAIHQYRICIIEGTTRQARKDKTQIRLQVLADQGNQCASCGDPVSLAGHSCLTPDFVVICAVCRLKQNKARRCEI